RKLEQIVGAPKCILPSCGTDGRIRVLYRQTRFVRRPVLASNCPGYAFSHAAECRARILPTARLYKLFPTRDAFPLFACADGAEAARYGRPPRPPGGRGGEAPTED